MKKIIIFILLFIVTVSAFTVEKIVRLEYKKKSGFMKFYLSDKDYNTDYGYYDVDLFTFDVDDNTVEPYKDKVDKDLIKRYGISYRLWKVSIPLASVGLTVGGFFFGGFMWVLVDSYYRPGQYRQEGYSSNYLQDVRNACVAIISLSSVVIAISFVFVGLFIYNVANCIKIKKQILGILNGDGVSFLETRNMRFNFAIDFSYRKTK